MSLFGEKAIVVEYCWLSGKDTHHDIRSKYRTLRVGAGQAAEFAKDLTALLKFLPHWNFDGSSTGQAAGLDTEIIIRPVAIFAHPFNTHVAAVALCDCYYPNGEPTKDNTRVRAKAVFDTALHLDPWFGLEQEYVLMKNGRPLDWPENGFPSPQGPYYCAVGAAAWGRKYALEHYDACLRMGIQLAGANAEVMPAQWEFQVGPCPGISCGDHVVMARWAYQHICEKYGLDVVYSVKPIKGDWNGSGLHTNFSTTETRNKTDGMKNIETYLGRLKHSLHKDLVFYGSENCERLSGHHETSKYDQFSYGIGTRHTSVRIPNDVAKDGFGYFEDRRPGGDADPYLVSARLFASAAGLAAPSLDAIEGQYRRSWMPTASPQ